MELFRLLTQAMPTRVIIFRLLPIAFMVASLPALLFLHSISWAIVAFLASFLCIVAWVLIGQKCIAAWAVAQNPQIVYWAQTREVSQGIARYGMRNHKVLTLHLRDGKQCEFIIPSDRLVQFASWLTERNPSVCWDSHYSQDAK